ncbi:hypothetical protein B0H16DRAFT_1571315 [Mycena metata]|uniref:Secreted protein n=1 Tax=Mycena metata TaxID=1033252 RepID=A0AAD7IAP1_9AGAR|nr:hypothetical protein B0H16DRAFT_1571315 [Mycena metata]
MPPVACFVVYGLLQWWRASGIRYVGVPGVPERQHSRAVFAGRRNEKSTMLQQSATEYDWLGEKETESGGLSIIGHR